MDLLREMKFAGCSSTASTSTASVSSLYLQLRLRPESSVFILRSTDNSLRSTVFQSSAGERFPAIVSGAACGSHKFHALRRRCHKSMFPFVVLPLTSPSPLKPPPLHSLALLPHSIFFSAVLWVTRLSMRYFGYQCCQFVFKLEKRTRKKKLKIASISFNGINIFRTNKFLINVHIN